MAPAPQQQSQGDNSLAAMWLTIFFFCLAGLIWYLYHTQIVWFVVEIKYAEAALISLFTPELNSTISGIQSLNTSGVTFPQLTYILDQIGNYIRYPFCIILLMMAGVLFTGHPAMRFKKTHTMKTLLEQEKYNWPQIMPVSKFNLVTENVNQGPWAMAMTPMQFAKKHNILYEERDTSQTKTLGHKERITVGLLRSEAHQVFALQVGHHFSRVENLNMHSKALFAVFAARANRDPDAAKAILDRIALSSAAGQLDFTGVEELLKKYKDSKLVTKVLQNHAFTMTVMASMIKLAREDGVVASADFLWLKLVDRPLWFMLNSIGRQTPPTEIAGAFAHWLAELKLGRKISVPMVEEAVKALDAALKDVLYIPDEKQ